MSPVYFKKWQCPMSLSFLSPVACSHAQCSPIDFKKKLCRRVEFKGRGLLCLNIMTPNVIIFSEYFPVVFTLETEIESQYEY